jgi:hypothetical protein
VCFACSLIKATQGGIKSETQVTPEVIKKVEPRFLFLSFPSPLCHFREGGNPVKHKNNQEIVPETFPLRGDFWIPAFAGMTRHRKWQS